MASQTLDANACAQHELPRTDQLQRAQWIRAAILGANDGLLSTTSIMLGVGAAKEDRWSMVLSGLAGAIAGACSMAVGEFVSVSTQRDIEKANLSHCSSKTASDGEGISTLTTINVETNLTMSPPAMLTEPKLLDSPFRRSPMMKVITEDAKTSTVKDEGEDNREDALPNPYKAATASALAFLCGAFVPLVSATFVAENTPRLLVIVIVTSLALVVFGGIGALLGGSPVKVSAVRVLVGGWLSMAVTYGLLKPFDRDDHHNHNEKDH